MSTEDAGLAHAARSLNLGPDALGNTLAVRDGRVTCFGASPLPEGQLDGVVRPVDAAGTRIRPGRINAHTHIYSGLAPLGMPAPHPEPENFVQILERVWWRLDRALDPASLRASARLYVAEALLAGTTTLIDHHESPNFIEGSLDVLAEACEELGMRAILCFGATERNGGREEARRGLSECRRFVERARRRPESMVQGLVALHASFTVSDETVQEAADLCRELDTVMHVHVAEDVADMVDARRRGYDDPLDRLLELGALPPGSILAHGVHLDAPAVRRAAERGLWFVQNPRSNRGNGVGYPKALGESARVALGTDGYPARLDDEIAVLREEATAHLEAEEAVERRPRAGYELVAERFGLTFSPFEEGGAADAVALEGRRARHVVVDGSLVVENGRLTQADFEEIRADARAQAKPLWERMEALA